MGIRHPAYQDRLLLYRMRDLYGYEERALATYLRHLARQHRTGLPLEALPTQICEATLEARDYVMVRHGSRTLAVYRVKPGGDISRLQRWPTALDRSRA
jgi:hypothetical protein